MSFRKQLFTAAVSLLALTSSAALAATQTAQSPRDAALRVVVSDPTGAVIVGAKVTLQPLDQTGAVRDAVTDQRGEALFENVPPARYAVRAEFPGFEPRQLDDLRLRAGGSTRREMRFVTPRGTRT